MKMKSLMVWAVPGILATSFAYIAPAMADDMTNNGQAMQQPPAQQPVTQPMAPTTTPATPAAPADMNTAPSQQNNASVPSDMSTPPSSSDEGTPDTATGDDDY